MATVKEQVKKIQNQYRRKTTATFKKWIVAQFGQQLKKGDRLFCTFDLEYGSPELWEVEKIEWEYSNPAVICLRIDSKGDYEKPFKSAKFSIRQGLARNMLRHCKLVEPTTVPADLFQYQVELDLQRGGERLTLSRTMKDTHLAARRLALKIVHEYEGRVGSTDSDYISLYDETGNHDGSWGHVSIKPKLKG